MCSLAQQAVNNDSLHYQFLLDSTIWNSSANATLDTFMLRYALYSDFVIGKVDTSHFPNQKSIRSIQIYDANSIIRKEIVFYENGGVSIIANLKGVNVENGLVIQYFRTGRISAFTVGDHSDRKVIEFRESGSISSISDNRKYQGINTAYHYYDGGALMTIVKYAPDHSYTTYSYRRDGTLEKSAKYIENGSLHGETKIYNKKGRYKKSLFFKNDVLAKGRS